MQKTRILRVLLEQYNVPYRRWPSIYLKGLCSLRAIKFNQPERKLNLLCNLSLYDCIPKIKSIGWSTMITSQENLNFMQSSMFKDHIFHKNQPTGTKVELALQVLIIWLYTKNQINRIRRFGKKCRKLETFKDHNFHKNNSTRTNIELAL